MDKFPILEIVPNSVAGGINKPSDNRVNNKQTYKIETLKDTTNSKKNPFEIKDTFERTTTDIKKPEEDKKLGIKDVAIGCAESIPYVRRIMGVENGANNKDYFKMALAGAILLANVPEDFRDLKNAKNQLLHPELLKSAPVGRDFQSVFSFFRGTWFEFLLKGEGKYTSKISEFLYNADKTLFDNKFFREKILGIGLGDFERQLTTRTDVFKNLVVASKVTDKSLLKRVLGGASMRMPVLGVIAFSLLEIPSIIKAFNNSNNAKDNLKNGFKQTVKSFINIVSVMGWSAILGWVLHRYKGPAGSLLGIGLGTALGSKQAQIINEKIDIEI